MEPTPADWHTCLDHFLAALIARRGSTSAATHYRANLLRLFGADFARSPSGITRAEVEAYLNAPSHGSIHAGQPVAASTRNARLAALSSFYQYAATYTYLGSDGTSRPMLSVTPPTLGMRYVQAARAPRGLSDDELRALFAAIPRDTVRGKRDRAVLLVFLWSLRRRSEIARLVRGDFMRMTFPSGRTVWTYAFRGKGHSSADDRAEMPEPAMTALLDYITASGRTWETMEAADSLFYAIAPEHGGGYAAGRDIPLTGHGLNRILKRCLKAAHLDSRHSLHALRHSGARARYESGQKLRSLQHALRHASIGTTDTYIRTIVGSEDDAPDALKERYGRL